MTAGGGIRQAVRVVVGFVEAQKTPKQKQSLASDRICCSVQAFTRRTVIDVPRFHLSSFPLMSCCHPSLWKGVKGNLDFLCVGIQPQITDIHEHIRNCGEMVFFHSVENW